MSKRYLLLRGARGNIGDIMAFASCYESIRRSTKDAELIPFPHAARITPEKANSYDKIYLCGGPVFGKQDNQFYKMVRFTDIKKVTTPIIPFGVGTQTRTPDENPFDEKSAEMLRQIHSNITFSGVRDNATKANLGKIGIINTKVIGYPAMYTYMSSQGKIENSEIDKIMVTTKHRSDVNETNYKILDRIYEKYGKKYELIYRVHDHRSILMNENPFWKAIEKYKVFTPQGSSFIIRSHSYDLSSMMHIGMRIHAHVTFLSYGQPSFLVQCDERGRSFSDTYHLTTDTHMTQWENIIDIVEHEIQNKFKGFRPFVQEYNNKAKAYIDFLREHMDLPPLSKPQDAHMECERL